MPRSTTPRLDPPTAAGDVAVRDPAPARFVGCDVGKASIVIFDSRDGRIRTIANRRAALDAFAASLDASCLIVCEATGGYEDALLAAALAAAIPAHRADARKVKAFIQSYGTCGKTDALDAHALATYGQELSGAYKRLRAAGKKPMVALVAIMRKLVVIANARLRDALFDALPRSGTTRQAGHPTIAA